jgi:hypothetical protein
MKLALPFASFGLLALPVQRYKFLDAGAAN